MRSEIAQLAAELVEHARQEGVMIAAAESCTGGLIAGAITDIAGSSAVFDRGFVTYSNAAKEEMLGVSSATLEAHGAVSRETVSEMANGALRNSRAGMAVAVTGIAGPGGGSMEKPVGLVFLGLARSGCESEVTELRLGDIGRDAVRRETVRAALEMMLKALAA